MHFDERGGMHQDLEQAEKANSEYRYARENPESYQRKKDSKLLGLFVLLSIISIPVFCFKFFALLGFPADEDPAGYFFLAMTVIIYMGYFIGMYKYHSKPLPGGILAYSIIFFSSMASVTFLMGLT